MTIEETLGQRLVRFRTAAGLSQRKLADKSGVNQATISRIESDAQASIALDGLRELATALGVPAAELIGEAAPAAAADSAASPAGSDPGEALLLLNPADLHPLNYRKTFSDESLREMVASIKERGILQALLVRPRPEGGHWIVAGERRWRATRLGIELGELPADFRLPCRNRTDITDREHLLAALTENLQREDVPPIEEAEAFLQLRKADPPFSTADIAAAVGKTMRYVQVRLGLLDRLCDRALKALRDGDITVTLARALMIAPHDRQAEALELISAGRFRTAKDLQAWVAGGMFPMDRAIFGLTLYNGPIVVDDDTGAKYLTDAPQVKRLQMEAVKQKASDLRTDGYGAVKIVENQDWWYPDSYAMEQEGWRVLRPNEKPRPGEQRAATIHVKADLSVNVRLDLVKGPKPVTGSAKAAAAKASDDPVDAVGTGQRILAHNVKTEALQNSLLHTRGVLFVHLAFALLAGGRLLKIKTEHCSPEERVIGQEVRAVLDDFRQKLGPANFTTPDAKSPYLELAFDRGLYSGRSKAEAAVLPKLYELDFVDLMTLVSALLASRCGSWLTMASGGTGYEIGDIAEALTAASALGITERLDGRRCIDEKYLSKLTGEQLEDLGYEIGVFAITSARRLTLMPAEFGRMKVTEQRQHLLRFVQANDVRYIPPVFAFGTSSEISKNVRDQACGDLMRAHRREANEAPPPAAGPKAAASAGRVPKMYMLRTCLEMLDEQGAMEVSNFRKNAGDIADWVLSSSYTRETKPEEVPFDEPGVTLSADGWAWLGQYSRTKFSVGSPVMNVPARPTLASGEATA